MRTTKSASRMKVFLSYAAKDKDLAQTIGAQLSEAGFRVRDPDRDRLPAADSSAEPESEIRSADAVVVFVSPEAMTSQWVSREIEYSLGAKHLSGRLIPVVVRPTKEAPWIFSALNPVRHKRVSQTGREIIGLLSQPAHVPQVKRLA